MAVPTDENGPSGLAEEAERSARTEYLADAGRAGDEADGDVIALEMMTRALVGLTLQSLNVLGGRVSLVQFRLLLALAGLGRVQSSRLAAEATMTASSVTRLADKLEAAGLVKRGTDPRSRSIVTVEVTEAGRDLVTRVVARRHELLAAVLERMTPPERAGIEAAARRFTELAADAAALGPTGPLPLLPVCPSPLPPLPLPLAPLVAEVVVRGHP